MPSPKRPSQRSSTPDRIEDFLADLIGDDAQPLKDRVTALMGLLIFAQQDAREHASDARTTAATFVSTPALWEELVRTGRGLPPGLAEVSQLVNDLGEVRALAMYVAIVARNALEDFHNKHLSDDTMRELNTIVRNAVYTALISMRDMLHSTYARGYVNYHTGHIPPYWEQPELLEGYAEESSGESTTNK